MKVKLIISICSKVIRWTRYGTTMFIILRGHLKTPKILYLNDFRATWFEIEYL